MGHTKAKQQLLKEKQSEEKMKLLREMAASGQQLAASGQQLAASISFANRLHRLDGLMKIAKRMKDKEIYVKALHEKKRLLYESVFLDQTPNQVTDIDDNGNRLHLLDELIKIAKRIKDKEMYVKALHEAKRLLYEYALDQTPNQATDVPVATPTNINAVPAAVETAMMSEMSSQET